MIWGRPAFFCFLIPHFLVIYLSIFCIIWGRDWNFFKMGKHQKISATQFPILPDFDCVLILQYGEWIAELDISEFHCHLLHNLFGLDLVFCRVFKFWMSSPYYSKTMQKNLTKWGSVLWNNNMGKAGFLLFFLIPHFVVIYLSTFCIIWGSD